MLAENDLRLAWHAQRRGLRSRRLALVTLALAAGDIHKHSWTETLWESLVRSHPQHPFARCFDREHALSDRRILRQLIRLRHTFPPVRVDWLLQREEVRTGPYRAQSLSTPLIVSDLLRWDRGLIRQRVREASIAVDVHDPMPKPIVSAMSGSPDPKAPDRSIIETASSASWIDCLASMLMVVQIHQIGKSAVALFRDDRPSTTSRTQPSTGKRSGSAVVIPHVPSDHIHMPKFADLEPSIYSLNRPVPRP